MTFIAALQGDNCALIATDLLVRFVPEETTEMVNFWGEKLRKNSYGDYFTFEGRLNERELAHLAKKRLEELTTKSLNTDPFFREGLSLNGLYTKIASAQLYAGYFDKPFTKLPNGAGFYASSDMKYATQLYHRTNVTLENFGLPDKNLLEGISEMWEAFFLEKEKKADFFGGFTSYIITPGKIKPFTKNLGKLEGLTEIVVTFD